jgi:hypothetical protein
VDEGTSKRRPNLTLEELRSLAAETGMPELYDDAVAAFEPLLKKHTTQSSISFGATFNGKEPADRTMAPILGGLTGNSA